MEKDHNPLLGLLQKQIGNVSLKMQKWYLTVKYRFKPVDVQGKKLHIADALSRRSTNMCAATNFLVDEGATVNTIPSVKKERTSESKNSTKYYEELLNLQLLIHSGWPQQYDQVPENLWIYWSKKEQLHYCNKFFLGKD